MASILKITDYDRMAVIAPHPDDECIGVGGVLSLYADKTDVIVLTDGSLGNEKITAEKERIIRKKQFLKEMEYIKIKNFFYLDYPDGDLINRPNCLDDIDLSNYTKVFVPWQGDNHPDHVAAFTYTVNAILKKKLTHIEIFQYEVHNSFSDISHYLDITDVLKEKKKMICCHLDQVDDFRYDVLVESLGKYRACQLNLPNRYVEGYRQFCYDDEKIGALPKYEKEIRKRTKSTEIFHLWLVLYKHNIFIADFLKENKMNRVSIYGYGNVGEMLCEELKKDGISIIDVFDQRELSVDIMGVNTKHPAEGDRSVDLVIVTVISDDIDVKNKLKHWGYNKVISLGDILKDMSLTYDGE